MTIVLMADLHRGQLPGRAAVRPGQRGITWWKVAIPVLTIIMLLFKFHASNFNPAAAASCRSASRRVFGAIPSAGIVFAYLGFEQADQLAAEIKNPQAQPAAGDHLATLSDRHLRPAAGRVHRRHTEQRASKGFQGIASTNPIAIYPFAAVAGLAGLGCLATILHIDAFVSPFGTGLIYQTSTSRVGYGLARNSYFPQADAGSTGTACRGSA